MAGPEVRRLTERDIDAAIHLTDLEHWGYTRADWARLLYLSPQGCFAAEVDGEVVGVLSTTSYDSVAFLGAVIVRPDLRGQHLGQAMMRAALAYLESAGVSSVRLNAYLNVIPFYQKLGFRREYGNCRWTGPAGGRAHHRVRTAWSEDLPAIRDLDSEYFGADRSALLTRLLEEFSARFLVADDRGRLRGFIVGNASGDSCEIGPWVTEPGDRSVARHLFEALVDATAAETFAFSSPDPNGSATLFARERGLAESFRTLRMVRGRPGHEGRPEGVWAFAGLEKG